MIKQPHEYPHRILLAVSGLSPQIITETLYGLSQQEDPFIPTEVHILTTHTGKKIATEGLFTVGKHFEKLCQDYQLEGITFSPEQIHVLKNNQGNPINDIVTEEDNIQLADFLTQHILNVIKKYEDDCSIHISIAGGRKTMSFYAGYALSLLGRNQDRLSHVLVSEGFDSLKDFFYPTPYDCKIEKRHYKTNELLATLNAKEAKVSVADIPFVRLSQTYKKGYLTENLSFSTLVQSAQIAANGKAFLKIVDKPHPDKGMLKIMQVFAHGIEIKFEPADAAFYRIFVDEICKNEDVGFLRPNPQQKVKDVHIEMTRRYLRNYKKYGLTGDFELAEISYQKNHGAMTRGDFDNRLSDIKKAFVNALGEQGAIPYIPAKLGNGKPYRLMLDAEQIETN